ncbi:hypothetical protein CAPTEDRAFT_225771 [Capitella teleta]|uniref:LicD/FKTN/FKRP nucleotidyltransferase domain-containing protein n=1 Tax=Capitella teleta TaxID=283909 RepID=R7TE34_CAPTE|nr:hypothetical protein CAPTEDRAFT_225771 [Capitella teleta]|eukprot:ELT89311.1 hypothetical protein CAPTEDRAFT_225771 [Capitella teleta]
MKLWKTWLAVVVLLGLPMCIIHQFSIEFSLRRYMNIFNRTAAAGAVPSHPMPLDIVSILLPANRTTNTTQLNGTTMTQSGHVVPVLKVPDVSELCSNPRVNDELAAMYSTFEWKSAPQLPRTLSKENAQQMRAFLIAIKDMFCALGISWSLFYGSLLGAYITHDCLPWDDDLDIIIQKDAIDLLAKMHKDGSLPKKYNIGYVLTSGLHKLYWAPGKKIKPYSWAWPFVDLMPYQETEKNIQNIDRNKGHRFDVPKSLALPFVMRPFGPLWLPAPRDSWKMMGVTYKEMKQFLCKAPGYDHVNERRRKDGKSTDCKNLHFQYRFVHREKSAEGGVLETLHLGDEPLYSVHYNEPLYPNTNPYKWLMAKS